jgi:hypothetical protein
MRAAVAAERFPSEVEDLLLEYFDRAATFLMNRDG